MTGIPKKYIKKLSIQSFICKVQQFTILLCHNKQFMQKTEKEIKEISKTIRNINHFNHTKKKLPTKNTPSSTIRQKYFLIKNK